MAVKNFATGRRRPDERARYQVSPKCREVATKLGIKPHIGGRLAWSSAALTAALLVVAIWHTFRYPVSAGDAGDVVVIILAMGSFPTVGTLVASRRPDNPIGWIFCAMGFLFVAALFVSNYAEYGLVVEPGSLPAAEIAGLITSWIWPVVLSPVGLVLLLFPNGRPLSPRWRLVVRVLSGAIVGWILVRTFVPGPLTDAGYESVRNPFGIDALGGVLKPLGGFFALALAVGVLLSIVAIVIRFRRSHGEERRQLKWLAFAGCVVALAAIISIPAEGIADDDSVLVRIAQLSLVASLSTVPIAAGIAILKYRLYDIDVIINRTLVYGGLTAVLAVVYAAGVVGLGEVLRSVTGQDRNTLAVAASTLAVAALFRPARGRFQGFIDRRFYRRKYDAVKTLEAFSGRLRDEVELEALTADLMAVVEDTMQPSRVSLWLRQTPSAGPP